MVIIAHRGNILGPNLEAENTVDHIRVALKNGFHVEVDVRYHDGQLWLGHDQLGESVPVEFLDNPHIWCHAKNLAALTYLIEQNIHVFWHDKDEYTLTSRGYIWTGSEVYESRNGQSRVYAVCTDFPVSARGIRPIPGEVGT